MKPFAVLCVLGTVEPEALARAGDTARFLQASGVEVELVNDGSWLGILSRQLRSPRIMIAMSSGVTALVASWIAGAPLRIVRQEGGWLARTLAPHVAKDDAALLELLERLMPTTSRQAGLPLAMKRAIDLALAVPALLAALPVLGGTAVAVRIALGSPVLFSQTRPGRAGRQFRIYKFRTMTNERGPDGALLPDAERLTWLGRLLRASSIDELPQLVNVVRGDMSLVGPRPLLPQYLERYSAEQRRRHNVVPGITGLAQINGRNATTWSERLRWDVAYVDEWSLALDAKILFRTVFAVAARRDVSRQGHATMPEFRGDENC